MTWNDGRLLITEGGIELLKRVLLEIENAFLFLPKGSVPIESATLVEWGFFWISGRELFVRRATICYQVSMENLRRDYNLNYALKNDQ